MFDVSCHDHRPPSSTTLWAHSSFTSSRLRSWTFIGTRSHVRIAKNANVKKTRFCDKTGRSGSTLQIINGIILLLVFFSVRIVYGTYISGVFFKEVYYRWSEIPKYVSIVYGFANVSLNSLNAFWFYKMVKSVSSRVRGGVVSDDRGGHVQLPAQKTETKKTT